ncbi:MAG: hypothetical protein H0Z34_09495 [Brevibacillus sp.]|nr:hypothetical protein [Brevibacillus sp.]
MISRKTSERIMKWSVFLFTIFICLIGPYLINEVKLPAKVVNMIYFSVYGVFIIAMLQAVVFDFFRDDKKQGLIVVGLNLLAILGYVLVEHLL